MRNLENPSQRFLDPQVIAKITPLQLRAKYLLDGFQAGQYRRPARGFSNEFYQHREYVAGDDHRRIDWKVFGRTDKFYLKQFEDESNQLVYFILDVSGSMSYQGPSSPLSKLEYGQCLTACLAWLAVEQRDAASLTLFNDSTFKSFPAVESPDALTDLMVALDTANSIQSDGKQNRLGLTSAIQELSKRGIVFVFSDFFGPKDDILNGLRLLRHQGNDVIAVHVVDSCEVEFPFDKTTLFRGMESPVNLLVNPRRVRKTYLKRFGEFCQFLKRECANLEIEFHQISTERNIATAIESLLSNRVESAAGP